MAKQIRKLKRAGVDKKRKKPNKEPFVARPAPPPSPSSGAALKPLLIRIGLPLLAVWVVGSLIAGFTTSQTAIIVALGVPAVLTLAAAGLVAWALRQTKRAQGVAGILSAADSAEKRRDALDRLDSSFKKKDPAAIFAKAQLLMQEDPEEALRVLETVNLEKVMAPVADQARGQRAMIHLMKGDVGPARDLADGIELNRHQDSKERAMLGAVLAEAWARTGQAKKAVETLELFDPEDDEFEQLRPQLYRSRAFAYAYVSRMKEVRRALRKLLDVDPRLLGGFLVKKTHPLLQKEARRMLERSGQMPRKMVIQRKM